MLPKHSGTVDVAQPGQAADCLSGLVTLSIYSCPCGRHREARLHPLSSCIRWRRTRPMGHGVRAPRSAGDFRAHLIIRARPLLNEILFVEPAITCDLCLDLTNYVAPFARPRLLEAPIRSAQILIANRFGPDFLKGSSWVSLLQGPSISVWSNMKKPLTGAAK
jgi:hypothetical protein